MKILEINKFNFANAGADKHFLDLVKLLRAKGNDVAVFAMDHSRNEFSPWKKYFLSYVGYNHNDSTLWQKIKGAFRMFYSWEARRKIGKLLDDFQPDIVHIHNIYHQISPSILSEIKKRGLPIVMTVHDYALICPDYLMECNGKNWEEIKKGGWLSFVTNKCFKDSYVKSLIAILRFNFHKYLDIYDKNIDLYISPSIFTKNILVQNGLAENKIIVLPHFHTMELSDGCDKNANKERYVFYAGRISADKGVGELIGTFKKLENITLYLAGKKDENFILEETENIKYIGFLSHKGIMRYIKNSLFVVSFSRLPETFGLVALEAASQAKPFIGFDSGAYGEIIEDGKDGYLCRNTDEIREKIEKLSEDEGLRILFSRNALKKAERFDRRQYYLNIMDIFSDSSRKSKRA
ncbi:MAG: glycosyltransferase [Parcubacteria group bacterium]